ncbi:helix-turn-helix domain-containing protein [Dehalobacter sp. 4CP]|uniref:helix-turn-helix domain-containing protein n=1 Tax=Dehalobacter sp. CP TaxID=2594474 RepID=UPI0039ECB4B1
MAKYSYKQRLEAVMKVTEKHMSCKAVGRLLGCGDTHVRRWVKRYENFGVEGLIRKPRISPMIMKTMNILLSTIQKIVKNFKTIT